MADKMTNAVETGKKALNNTVKALAALVVISWTQIALADTLSKTDPAVIAKCDKNGDTKIKWKEYVCYLNMKKQNAQEGLENAQEGLENAQEKWKQLDKDIKKVRKIKELLAQK